jgi:hypothetical protein
MTQLGELLKVSLALDKRVKDKCPFCKESPHEFGSEKKKKLSDVVKSKPKALNCAKFEEGTSHKDYRYTTASHHLICAIQCYAPIKTLVRMGNLAGYDINCPENGLPLPTVRNKYGGKNFGELSDDKVLDGYSEQDLIAYGVMDRTRAQWHVGHHAFEITIVEYDETEGGDDEEYPHRTSYDCEVIERLLNLAQGAINTNLCKDEEGKDEFKKNMDEISKDIASHLAEFNSSNPYASAPYFVSDRAFQYANAVAASGPAKWKRDAKVEVLKYQG